MHSVPLIRNPHHLLKNSKLAGHCQVKLELNVCSFIMNVVLVHKRDIFMLRVHQIDSASSRKCLLSCFYIEISRYTSSLGSKLAGKSRDLSQQIATDMLTR